jgi:hypothetical protein
MTKEIYEALEKRLLEKVPGLKYVDWYYGQYDEADDDAMVWITPSVFLEFFPMDWQQLGQSGMQMGTLRFTTHVVTDTAYDDKQRMTVHNHLSFEKSVYIALQGWDCMLSYLDNYAALANTNNDVQLFNSITRETSESDHALQRFIVTKASYECNVIDASLSLLLVGDMTDVSNVVLDLEVDKVDFIP